MTTDTSATSDSLLAGGSVDPDRPTDGDDFGPLGQCVYEMSTGKRCPKAAKVVLKIGLVFARTDPTPYGYCTSHALAVTEPRDPRIHRTAEPLERFEEVIE